MYSVLLVEDEKLELETLRDYVDWKSLGITGFIRQETGKEPWNMWKNTIRIL